VSQKRTGVCRIREFAALAGVTVRALHHYDRLGLLKPSGRSTSAYRLYRDCDLARLEQIVVTAMRNRRVRRAPIEERAPLCWLLAWAACFQSKDPRGARLSSRARRYR
jgi:MerR-like DNA binding protein